MNMATTAVNLKRNWTLIKVNLKNTQQYEKSPEGNKGNSGRKY